MKTAENSRHLKVALVISELDVGGAEKNFVNLACLLATRGHSVRVFCLDPRPAPGNDSLVCWLEDVGIVVEFLRKPRIWPSPWGHTTELGHRLSAFGPEIVYSFLFRANLASILARTSGSDSPKSATPPQRIIGLRQADPRRWVNYFERFCIQHSQAAICVSTQVARYYEPGVSPIRPDHVQANRLGQVLVIPNAVQVHVNDLDLPPGPCQNLLGLPWSNSESKPFLLYVGRLTAQKGLVELIKASPQFLDKLPEHQLVLIGQGPQLQTLQSLASKLPCAHRIHFLGWLPNPLAYIQAADLVLLHSQWEGLPNVLLETMSVGKPFVALETHGVQDIFHPPNAEPTIVQFPTENCLTASDAQRWQMVAKPAQFPQAVVDLASNQKQAKIVGKWNQSWVARHFTLTEFLTSHEQVFLKLAGK